ncbi:hypothetical protein HPB50_015761 [Hyalomma asiaticum]|uniref:Uncharacterized protein n=1 Tax=Hyalomma asiaticum TaxID=266040 RepID=A0ACB7SV76_HYAAI|nr:hypothetical protein HPB50_015761 [Hyalomma asiaticum]
MSTRPVRLERVARSREDTRTRNTGRPLNARSSSTSEQHSAFRERFEAVYVVDSSTDAQSSVARVELCQLGLPGSKHSSGHKCGTDGCRGLGREPRRRPSVDKTTSTEGTDAVDLSNVSAMIFPTREEATGRRRKRMEGGARTELSSSSSQESRVRSND